MSSCVMRTKTLSSSALDPSGRLSGFVAPEKRMAGATQKIFLSPNYLGLGLREFFGFLWFVFDNLTQSHAMLQGREILPWSHPKLVTREHASPWGRTRRPFSRAASFLNWAKSFSIAVTFSAKNVVAAAEQCFAGNYFI